VLPVIVLWDSAYRITAALGGAAASKSSKNGGLLESAFVAGAG
jgi:hypothetical protein